MVDQISNKRDRNSNREAWDRWARDRPLLHIAHIEDELNFFRSGEVVIKKHYAETFDLIPIKGRVLDIGCGIGRLTFAAYHHRPTLQIFGLDVSHEMIAQANERIKDENIVFLAGNGKDLDMFGDAYFDMIFSHVVLQHLPTKVVEGYLNEASRVLRPGGYLSFQVQFDKARLDEKLTIPDTNFRKLRFYSSDEIRSMIPTSFNVLEVTQTKEKRIHNVIVRCRRKSD